MPESPFPPCIERECEKNRNGLCEFLNETGGTENVLCGWFSYKSDKECNKCAHSVTREGKRMKFCKLKNKAIPPKLDACAHWKER